MQTPPCGTGRATQLCTMQPPTATDRTLNWYVWGPGPGPGGWAGGGSRNRAIVCLQVLITESGTVELGEEETMSVAGLCLGRTSTFLFVAALRNVL